MHCCNNFCYRSGCRKHDWSPESESVDQHTSPDEKGEGKDLSLRTKVVRLEGRGGFENLGGEISRSY